MPHQTLSYRNFTSYRLKNQYATVGGSPYQTGLYTHSSGQDAIGTILDYKKKRADYKTLNREAELLALINEKHKGKKTNVTVPELFTVIDRGGRIILIRAHVEGVPLTKLNQGAKVTAYLECVKELAGIHASLTDTEKAAVPTLSYKSMKRRFPRLIAHAFIKDQGLLITLLKLTYAFYRHPEPKIGASLTLASRALGASSVICGRDRVYMTDMRRTIIAPVGTDEALFPQLYYREVGPDTMKSYLDARCDTPAKAYRFLHIAAFYSVYFDDHDYMQILSDSIIPYVTGAFKQSAQSNRSLSLAVSHKS